MEELAYIEEGDGQWRSVEGQGVVVPPKPNFGRSKYKVSFAPPRKKNSKVLFIKENECIKMNCCTKVRFLVVKSVNNCKTV